MVCDDCYERRATIHLGHGICLCDQCMLNFNRELVLTKMKKRQMVLQQIEIK